MPINISVIILRIVNSSFLLSLSPLLFASPSWVRCPPLLSPLKIHWRLATHWPPIPQCTTLWLPSRSLHKETTGLLTEEYQDWNDIYDEHMLKLVFYNLGTELWPAFMCYWRGDGLIRGLIRGNNPHRITTLMPGHAQVVLSRKTETSTLLREARNTPWMTE